MNLNRSALVVVDMQHYFVEPQSSLMTLVESLQPGSVTPYAERVRETVIPAIQRLLHSFRALKSPTFFTEFASHTPDGSDLPLWARRINDLALSTIETMAYPVFDDSSASIIPALLPEMGELADRGYDVVLVEEGCATLSPDAHQATLESFGVIFGQAKSADEISGELVAAT